MDRTNVRYLKPEDIPEKLDFASADVSFISLTKILEPVKELLKSTAEMVCLIKPQFEAGREQVGKKGVVRDKKVHEEVIQKVCEYAGSVDLSPVALSFSPIKGPEGNIEYLVYLKKESSDPDIFDTGLSISAIVEEAHNSLNV